MAYDILQIEADMAALHRSIRETEAGLAETLHLKNRLVAHVEELLEENRKTNRELAYWMGRANELGEQLEAAR